VKDFQSWTLLHGAVAILQLHIFILTGSPLIAALIGWETAWTIHYGLKWIDQ